MAVEARPGAARRARAIAEMDSINVGLESWIIQDGNYTDFSVGERRRFALDFVAEQDWRTATSPVPHMAHVHGDRYDVTARVAFLSSRTWVIDCGNFLLYREEPPPKGLPESLISGRIRVGIDPFFYREDLRTLPGMPDLYNDFRIEGVELETTPWLPEGDGMRRQTGEPTFVDLNRTDAWNDDDGNGTYVLLCRRVTSAD
jgi:hypothetical protein